MKTIQLTKIFAFLIAMFFMSCFLCIRLIKEIIILGLAIGIIFIFNGCQQTIKETTLPEQNILEESYLFEDFGMDIDTVIYQNISYLKWKKEIPIKNIDHIKELFFKVKEQKQKEIIFFEEQKMPLRYREEIDNMLFEFEFQVYKNYGYNFNASKGFYKTRQLTEEEKQEIYYDLQVVKSFKNEITQVADSYQMY